MSARIHARDVVQQQFQTDSLPEQRCEVAKRHHASTSQIVATESGETYDEWQERVHAADPPLLSAQTGSSSSSSSSRVPQPPPGPPPKGLRKSISTPDPQQQPMSARYPEQQEEEEQQNQNLLSWVEYRDAAIEQGDQNLLSFAAFITSFETKTSSSATSSSPSAAGVGSRSRRGLVAELERLSQERERNIISEQEFKAAKTRLLLDASSQGQEERGSKRKIEGGGNNDDQPK